MKFWIREVYGISGYEICTYEVEADSEQEAIDLINDHEVDAIDIDTNIKQSEFESREIKIKE